MKKLKNKTFFTIFTIFSLFLLIPLSAYNFQYYQRERSNIENNLKKISTNLIFLNPSENKRIIMDYNVYMLVLDDYNDIKNVISFSETNYNKIIIKEAKKELKKDTKDGPIVKNLYFNNYAYYLKNNNFITVMDVNFVSDKLVSLLVSSLILYILGEFIILYLSMIITRWIIKPAIDSFNKQKEFIADASHELKTPIAVIMASADALENDLTEKKWLNNIKDETERMNDLVSNLLKLSQLENEILNDDNNWINLSKVVEKSVVSFESICFENNLKIKSKIRGNINLKCNSRKISELLSILLDNAIKHSEKNSEIVVILNKVKNEIILEVKNKGKPIPEEDYERIFERFYRSDKSRNRDSNRYGLGLAIAKNIVESYDGTIKVSCQKGITTFKVVFKHKEH